VIGGAFYFSVVICNCGSMALDVLAGRLNTTVGGHARCAACVCHIGLESGGARWVQRAFNDCKRGLVTSKMGCKSTPHNLHPLHPHICVAPIVTKGSNDGKI